VHPTPQSASTPYQCCPLLSCFEHINRWTCPGMSSAGPFYPSKLHLRARGDLDLHLIHGSLGCPSHTPNGISIAVELFLQGSRSWQTNSPSVARRCIAAMRPSNVQITFISYNICWKITKLLFRNTYHRHRPAVASSSHRSRQVASLTHYLQFSTAAITRRPCCRRELPRDAERLYRKLAPNPRATQ